MRVAVSVGGGYAKFDRFAQHSEYDRVFARVVAGTDGMVADFVQEQESLLTRGWKRLQEIAGDEIAIIEYPLPEVIRKNRQRSPGI